jgi:radical SAM superfamily enzyme YgiQ (UPF0313 family)
MPIGLEYLAGAVIKAGHEVDLIDLCFSDNPEEDLHRAIQTLKPDITGISIRQVDTALYRGNRFFLPEIRNYVQVCKDYGFPVVLGGSGFSIMPDKILKYTGAQYGICGPGEQMLVELLDQLQQGTLSDTISLLDGYRALTADHPAVYRADIVDPSPYIENEGVFGFRTQHGCSENCFFCVEAGTPLSHCTPEAVAWEIKQLVDRGATQFHLCDAEFNDSVSHCIGVCRAIMETTGPVPWTPYMKPEPITGELFRLLAGSGVTMITLSINTLQYGQDHFTRLEPFFLLAQEHGIKVMVDLSVGYPDESPAATARMLDFLDGLPLHSVGVNSYFRVYPGTPLYKRICATPGLQDRLLPGFPADDFLAPVFFCQISEQELRQLIAGRQKFRIEGFDMATNYQRMERDDDGKTM